MTHCANFATCSSLTCNKHHYHNLTCELRTQVKSLQDELFSELPTCPKGRRPCNFGLLCHHAPSDCSFFHFGVSLDKRKEFIKGVRKIEQRARAAAKVEADIQNIRNGASIVWADVCE
jgi:hypothetical protein